ncbi:MAG: hypothetical protein ACLGG7_12090 [Bacteriovoracia bacterium]
MKLSPALILIALLGLLACTKKAELKKDGVGVELAGLVWEIASTSEGRWKVGKHLTNTVTKNVNFVLKLPKIDSADMEFMASTYKVDAWLIRVIQTSAQNGRMELVTLYAPFIARTAARSPGQMMKSVSLNLTYAAAAMSERFRRFNCPAFSHNKRVDEWSVIGDMAPISLVIQPQATFSEKLKPSDLVPMTLNVGHTMVGEYTIEVALFSTATKQIYSSFRQLPQGLRVSSEYAIQVDGCDGVHEEYNTPN